MLLTALAVMAAGCGSSNPFRVAALRFESGRD